MSENFDPVLELEDGYFSGLKISFIKTSTDHLFVTISGDSQTQRDSIILKPSDAYLIGEFLKNWED